MSEAGGGGQEEEEEEEENKKYVFLYTFYFNIVQWDWCIHSYLHWHLPENGDLSLKRAEGMCLCTICAHVGVYKCVYAQYVHTLVYINDRMNRCLTWSPWWRDNKRVYEPTHAWNSTPVTKDSCVLNTSYGEKCVTHMSQAATLPVEHSYGRQRVETSLGHEPLFLAHHGALCCCTAQE